MADGGAEARRDRRTARGELIGRTVDYLFGRNSLIGIASLMLLAISGYATWSGMHDFIVGVSTSPAAQSRDIGGGLSVSNDLLVAAIVVALTFLMWLALRETFGAERKWRERLVTFPLYLFLALWSIGFGYGFWWSLIAGEEATRTSLAGLREDARDAGTSISARLDAVRIQLDSVVSWSESQMAREETSGGSCGVPSGAGRGPLYNARRSVRDAIASLRDNVANAWLAPVQVDLDNLKASASALQGDTVLERQQNFEAMAARIRGTARAIAARSNELGKSTAAEMRAIAQSVAALPNTPGFSCSDPTLAERLRQAALQADQPAVLKLREAAFNEGPAGVANAVKNLWQNLGTYLSSAVRYVLSAGQAAGATDGGTPITGRDMIALLATVGIDLGLFVLTVLNPTSTPPVRHQPSTAVIRQVRAAMETAMKRAPDVDMEWLRRHFLYHHGASYLVTPNLYGCDPANKAEGTRALAMNQLAGVFDDLNLVRWPTRKELKDIVAEETANSLTDLTEIRRKRIEDLEARNQNEGARIQLDQKRAEKLRTAQPLRNHGLLSKAERALAIAGWSDHAIRDIEIYRIVDTDGLTPLLMVLNDADEPAANMAGPSSAPRPAAAVPERSGPPGVA